MSVSKEKNGTYTVQCWYRERLTGERRKKTKRGFARKAERPIGSATSSQRSRVRQP